MRRAARPAGVGAIVLCLLAVVIFVGMRGRSDGASRSFSRAGSSPVSWSSSDHPLGFDAPRRSYTVEYDRESLAGNERQTTHETLRVSRPFRSRVDATTADGVRAFTRRSALGKYENESSTNDRGVLVTPPALAAGDLRPEIALPAAVAAGLVELAGRRRVLGRECQVYRAGAPLSSGEIVAYRAGATEWTESCLDRDGLLLEELWWLDGLPVERLIAREVSFGRLNGGLFAITSAPVGSIAEGNGDLREVAIESRLPAPVFHELRGVPARFEHAGRYAVVWPAGSAVQGSSDRVGTLVDLWVDGVDVIMFERGGTLHGTAVFGDPPASASPIELGAAGAGVLVLGVRGNEVRAVPVKGQFVRIVATLPPEELISLASGIEAVEGGPLVER